LSALAAAVLGLAGAAGAAAGTADNSRWQYLENPDPFANGIVAVAQHAQPDGARAMVRCWSATRVFDLRLGFPEVGSRPLRALEMQFDIAPSVTPAWRLSPNRSTVIIAREDQAQVLSGLRRANDVTLVASFEDGTQQRVALYLRGSSVAIGRVLEVCGPLHATLR
ncbi:MAG: hypothetical protein ACNA7W_13005, partial [Pseudomonadales bacterium]